MSASFNIAPEYQTDEVKDILNLIDELKKEKEILLTKLLTTFVDKYSEVRIMTIDNHIRKLRKELDEEIKKASSKSEKVLLIFVYSDDHAYLWEYRY